MRISFALCLLLMVPMAGAETVLTPVDATELRAELDSHKGKVVLVSFWATWCVPCLKEIPELQALEAELPPGQFSLLPVSLDEAADRESLVRPFIDEHFAGFSSFTRARGGMDALVSVIDPAWNEILPTAYLLAADGTVVQRWQGGKTAEDFRSAIEPLLSVSD